MSTLDPSALSTSVPDKPQVLVNSTSIMGYSYDASNYVLHIWYKGVKQPIYRYLMVYPTTVAQIFSTGPSIGIKARNILKTLPRLKLR